MKKTYADYLLKHSKEFYEKVAVSFSKTRFGFWSDLNFLIDYIDSGDKVLDLGCGNGRLFDVLKDKKVEYIGVDNSYKLLLEARKLHAENQYRFIEADALNLPFKDNEFDKIVSIAVLQHIPSYNYRILFLKECLRTLKKGGKLILTVWLVKNTSKHYSFKQHAINNIKSFFKISEMDVNDLIIPFCAGDANLGTRYLHIFSLKEIANLFKKAGFNICDKGYTVDKKGIKRNIYIIASKG